MSSKIVPLIPPHTVYVEPYAGGAAVLFAKPWPKVTNTHHYREVINDIDGDLINFYRQLRDNREEIIEKLQLTPYSEKEHALSKKIEGDDLERARRYFVNISQGFSNRLNSGWSRGKFGRNLAVTWMKRVDRLQEYLDRMKSIHISNTPALKCIKQWDSPQTFFYIDPPYPGADQGHYDGYTEDDFAELCACLESIEGSFVLSNYDSDIPSDDWERFDFQAHSSSTPATSATKESGKRTEVCWRHISTHPVRPEIQKLYDSGKFDCFVGSSRQMKLI